MAHAARYGKSSADAVAGAIVGRELCERTAGDRSPAPTPPERARRWLEAIHVEDADLSDDDRLIDGLGEPAKVDDTAQEKRHPAHHARRAPRPAAYVVLNIGCGSCVPATASRP
jgi:hypothetical protein